MGKAFMAGGLEAYIACDGWPGCDGTLFELHYFYYLVHKKLSRTEAWRRAASFDEDSRNWVWYDASGRHTVRDE